MISRPRLKTGLGVNLVGEKWIQWLFRLVLILSLLILILSPYPASWKWFMMAVLLFYEIGHEINYYVVGKRFGKAARYWHIPFNIFLISLLFVQLEKGVVDFYWLYLIPIVEAALVYGFNTGIATAGVGTITYSGFFWLYFPKEEGAYAHLLFTVSLFFIGGAITGYMANMVMREKGAQERAGEVVSKLENVNEELSLLYNITRMLGESGRFEAHFPRVLEKISRVLGADVVAVFLLDKAGRELIVKAVHGLPVETISGLRMKIGDKVVGGAVSRKKPLVFEQKSLDELRKSNQWISIVNPQASIFSPMVIKGKVLGVLNVNYREPHNFSTEEINFLWATAEHLALVIDDIVLYRNLEFLSTRDSLTGLYNRGHFHKRLDEELSRAERYNSELTLILLDIDHFKEYNDLYGHVLGDEFLQQIGKLIQGNIREVDFAARYGGEEFTIILPNTGKIGALTLAERIRRVVAGAKFPGGEGKPVHKTISLGVATYPEDARNGRGLISRADQAMYQAKRQGRNQVQPYQKKWREKGERK